MQPQDMERLLAACGSHINEERKAAEATATQMMKKKDCVPLLVAQLSHSQNPGVRQLASILLRKKILGHWRKIGDIATKTEIKKALLHCATNEPIRVVRLGIAHCVAMLAKAEVPSGTWPELFEFLKTNSQSPKAEARELVILLLHACSETLAAQLGSQASVISQFLLQGLGDSEQSIRVQTLKTASAFLSVIDLDVSVITQLLPAMFSVLQASLSSDDEELFTTAFDLLDDLLEIPSFKGKTETLTQIINFSLHIAGSGANTNLKYREKACEILAKVAYMRPKTVIKGNFVEPMCEVAMKLLGDPACTVCTLEPDEDVMSHVGIGSLLLDAMASGLPSRVIGTPMLTWIKQQLIDASNADPFAKKASILALGALSCGCRDMLREHVDFVVEVAKLCVTDPNPMVKEAALVSSSLLTDYLQPEILEYHSVLMPLGIELLVDQNPYVREKAAVMIDSFAENLEGDVAPYAPSLMNGLATLITTNAGPEGSKGQCVAVSAVSSVAQALGDQFAPFAEDTLKMLLPFLKVTDDELLTMRARATDTIGVVASAAGAEHFNKYFPSVMQAVAEGFTLGSHELYEYSFGFWANMAELYPKEMGQALGSTVPQLFAVLDMKEGEFTSGNPFGAVPETGISDSEDDSEPEDTESEGYEGVTRIDNRLSLAVASALHCLGIFAKTGDLTLEPFTGEIYLRALSFVHHFNTMVRKNAMLLAVYLTLWVHKKSYVAPVVGFPSNDTLPDDVRKNVNETLMLSLEVIRNDDNKEVVAQACDGIAEIAEKMGSVAVHNHIDAIIGEVKKLMSLQTPCQLVAESDEDDDEDLPEDHDQLLIDSVFDMVDRIAKAYGEGFRQLFDEIFPYIVKYLGKDRPSSDHYMAIGTIGECVSAMKEKIAGHVDTFVKICDEGMRSKDSGVRSNSCYTIGAVCAGGKAQALPHYQTILPLLGEIIGREGERKEAVDNAVSALCRMARENPSACFLPQTLPAMLNHVPLKADFSENANVYSTIKLLMHTLPDVTAPVLPQIVASFAKALALSTTQTDIKVEISSTLQGVATENPAAIRSVVSTLPSDVQQAFSQSVFIPSSP